MNPPDLDAISQLATSLARSTGEILREGRRNWAGVTETKSSEVDLVTETDKAAERHIVETLRTERPDDAIIGEEGANDSGTSGVTWIVDPLDGTVNFTYGYPVYCVSVGVEIDGIPSVGAIYNPESGDLYTAIVGRGAFLNGVAIHARPETSPQLALLATGFSYSSNDRAAQALVMTTVLPVVRDIRRGGSAALEMCNLATGYIDAYYERHVKPWDITAGVVIATEAGALCTAIEDGSGVLTMLAARPGLHKELSSLLAQAE